MSPEDAYECTKDFARAFPRTMRGEFARTEMVDGKTKFVMLTPGRLFLEALIPMRITRQQFDAMLREAAATETNWAKAKVKLIGMARAASRQAWIDTTQRPAAVAPKASAGGPAAPERPGFVRRQGESMLAYAQRLLTEERDHLTNSEIAGFEWFIEHRTHRPLQETKA